MADIATLGLAVDSRPVADASKELDRLREAAKKAEAAAGGMGSRTEQAAGRARDALGRFTKAGHEAAAANDNIDRSARRAAASFGNWHAVAVRLASVLGTIAGAMVTGAFIRYADAWSDMQSRVGAAIRDMDAAPALMKRIVDVANASYSPLGQTVEIYSRNVAVLRDLGRGATEAADFTEALNHALVLTATRGERAASVQNALSKAMAVGKLQAEGLETILAHGGEVAQALADELGTTVNGLRAMTSAGKITGDVIANALITRLEDLRERAAEMPATVEDAFVRLRTNLTAFIGQVDKAVGSSEMLAGAIMFVADNIDRVITYAATAVTMFGTYYVAAMAAAYLSTITLAGALAFLRAALIRTGIGALVVAAGELVYQFMRLVQAAGGFGNAMSLLGNVAVEVWDRIKLGAQALVESTSAGWEGMKATFLYALHDMAAEFANFIGGVAAAINSVFGTDLNTTPMSGMLADLNAAGNTAMVNRNAGRKSAAGLWAQATAPLESIKALQDVMAGAAEATDGAADAAARLNAALAETGGGGGAADKAAKAIKDVKDEAAKAAQAALDFGRDLVKGFVSDLRSGLEQGKGFWRSFGDAALNVLDKIIDKLLNNVIDALFQVNSTASGLGGGGGGGGFLGGVFGWIGKLFGFASGGYTGPGSMYQPAGIVHAGEYVMSKAAVDRVGVGTMEAIHRTARGYAQGGFVAANGNAPVAANGNRPTATIVQHFHISGAISSRDVQVMVKQGSAQAVDEVKRNLQGWSIQLGQDGAIA